MVSDRPTPRQTRAEVDARRAQTAALARDAQRLRRWSRQIAARHQALLEQYRQWLDQHPRPPGVDDVHP